MYMCMYINIIIIHLLSNPLTDEITGESFNLDFLSRPVEGEYVPMETEAEEPIEQEPVAIQACDSVAQFIGGSAKARADTLKVHRMLCTKLYAANQRVGNTKAYTTWFGTYSPLNSYIVKDRYSQIIFKISFNPVVYNFNPDKSKCTNGELLAYTSSGSNQIFLCDNFVKATNLCTKDASKSKEHELVRTWAIAAFGAKEYSTGEQPTKDLAKKNPSKAIYNAESYAYFYCRP